MMSPDEKLYHLGEIVSPLLTSPRKLSALRHDADSANACFIFLDAELFLDRVQAAPLITHLRMEEKLRGVTAVFVSSLNAAARHADYTCNATYARFLATDLIAWIERELEPHPQYILCGLSLSGLQAAFTALSYPAVFRAALCQSPSAWWNHEWLAQQVPSLTSRPQRFWLSVGTEELQQDVSHAPSGMFQGVNQLDSCRRLTTALQAAGHQVHPHEYAGGHDPNCWAKELTDALRWLLTAPEP